MPIELLMPALSPTMTEGNLAKWHKKEGDAVKAGDVIAEIETDKATMEFEAVDEGTLGRILVPEGAQGVKVNQPIAVLLEEGEDASALAQVKPAAAPAPAKPAPSPSPAAAMPAAKPAAPAPITASSPAPTLTNGHAAGARIFASPLARRIAEQGKLDLARITGTGPHGRIVKHDVEAALKGGAPRMPSAAPAARAPAMPMPAMPGPGAIGGARYTKDQVAALAGNTPFTEHPITGMRRVIATRLSESEVRAALLPHRRLRDRRALEGAVRHQRRARHQDLGQRLRHQGCGAQLAQSAGGQRLLERGCDPAMAGRPMSRSRWHSPEGLITPIIKHADKKAIPLISAEMRELAERAKEGKLKLDEFQGGTISISNLGMYGTRQFTAVINPPQSAIIAVGAGEKRAVVKDGALAIATVMSCTATFDHRVVDGAVGAQFMAAFKKLIEAPGALLI